MDFAFYNSDPDRGVLQLAVRPVRRLMRRLQRPYFFRLRDLLTFLFHKHLELRQQADDLTAHVHAVQDLVNRRADDLQRQVAELQQRNADLQRQVEAAQAHAKLFGMDYLAVTRRLALLEDLLLQAHAALPAVPAADAPTAEPAESADISVFPAIARAKAC